MSLANNITDKDISDNEPKVLCDYCFDRYGMMSFCFCDEDD
jgi:hypothetical protein